MWWSPIWCMCCTILNRPCRLVPASPLTFKKKMCCEDGELGGLLFRREGVCVQGNLTIETQERLVLKKKKKKICSFKLT